MRQMIQNLSDFARLAGLVLLLGTFGCQTMPHGAVVPSGPYEQTVPSVGVSDPAPMARCDTTPRELAKVILPTYRIEPPDVLMIDAIHVVPLPPYHLRTLDSLIIDVQGTLPDAPISGIYVIEPGGRVNLGFSYGSVNVANLTAEEAKAAVEEHLGQTLAAPVVSVTLGDMAAKQQIMGEHLVAPDGTVTLGSYGGVSVIGMTLAEAKQAIETHLSRFLENPEISVDVWAYNSKVYYVVTQGAGMGDGLYRFPITGNETVLDAISQINGLEQVSSKRIWIARPTRQPGNVQILPVSWEAITAQAATGTNYQVLPGDRVFVAEDKLIALDSHLGKLIAPIERVMGFSILGVGTVTRFSGNVLGGGGNPSSNF